MTAPFRFGSVCSGIGAPEVAWRGLGWQPAFMSEIDAFPRAVLTHHFPEVPLHGDFTTIEAGQYAPIDLLVGGTPCQSFSIAGLRGGLADERGNLALEYLRLADRLRPRWLVWENVPGVLSSSGGRDFGAFLGGLGELGYGFAYRVLDAQYFGVAQRRQRVFVVGYLGDWRPSTAVLFEPASLRGDPAPRRGPAEGVAGAFAARSFDGGAGGRPEGAAAGHYVSVPHASGSASSGGYRNDVDTTGSLIAFGGNRTSGPLDVATAVRAKGGSGHGDFETETFIAAATARVAFNSREDPCCTGDVAGALGSSSPQAQAVAFSAKDHGADAGALAPTLRAMGHAGSHPNGGGQVAVAFAQNQRDEVRLMDVVGALAAEPGARQQTYAKRGAAVRRLTPRECERLQGFPDDYTAIPYRKGMAADGPRYRALGNSMAVPVMRWIGLRIAKVDSGLAGS